MHIRPPQPATPDAIHGETTQRQPDGDPVPRPFSITRNHLSTMGVYQVAPIAKRRRMISDTNYTLPRVATGWKRRCLRMTFDPSV